MTMATELQSLVVIGDCAKPRYIRPTLVTGGNLLTTSGIKVEQSNESGSNLQRRLTTPRDRRAISVPVHEPAAGGGHRTKKSDVILLCSGKNCLEVATIDSNSNWKNGSPNAAATEKIHKASGEETSELLLSKRLVRNQRRPQQEGSSSHPPQPSSHDPLINLCGFRSNRIYWLQNNDDSTDHNLNRRDGTSMTSVAARQHIWACQLPGSVKRSCRVNSGLSNLMANLNEHNSRNYPAVASGYIPRKPAWRSGSHQYSGSKMTGEDLANQCLRPTSLFDTSRCSGRYHSTTPMTSAGRQTATRSVGTGRRQVPMTSSLSVEGVQPLLSITSIDAKLFPAAGSPGLIASSSVLPS